MALSHGRGSDPHTIDTDDYEEPEPPVDWRLVLSAPAVVPASLGRALPARPLRKRAVSRAALSNSRKRASCRRCCGRRTGRPGGRHVRRSRTPSHTRPVLRRQRRGALPAYEPAVLARAGYSETGTSRSEAGREQQCVRPTRPLLLSCSRKHPRRDPRDARNAEQAVYREPTAQLLRGLAI
jgi:hypothetical protein